MKPNSTEHTDESKSDNIVAVRMFSLFQFADSSKSPNID